MDLLPDWVVAGRRDVRADGLQMTMSRYSLLPVPTDAAMRLSTIGGEVSTQASIKHKPGNADGTSLKKSVSIHAYTHFTV